MSGTRDKEAEKAEAKKIRKYIGSSFLIVITVVVLWTLVAYLLGGIESIGGLESPHWLFKNN